MGSHSLPLSENEAHLLPVLPLIYVAWADGELGPDEIIAIRSAAGAMDDVSPGASALLERWLDPDHPPSADELQRIRLRTRQALAASQERPTSVSDAGMTLARSAEPSIAQAWDTPSGAQALKRLREAAGVFGRTGLGDFLVPVPSPLQVDSESPFSVLEMTSVLEASYSEERAQIRAWIAQQTPSATDLEGPEYREQVLRWASDLASRGLGDLALGAANDSRTPDLGRFVAAFETLGLFDLSLMVKCGVQFGLFGGSILHLGTEAHHQRYLPRVSSLELPGCFAMTELGHGSNVRDLETTATFDPERDGFVIHSPCDSARKEWIGNAAVHGQMATVFAQLLVGDDGFGVHAFLVPIRDENGAACEGVEIRDSGHKLGLNGVDNGQLMFDRVFVPRENLLDRFASVSQDGVYHSPIASPGKRFFTMLGTLVGGRVSVAAAAVSVSKVALTIALRYATRRRQFGPEGGPEVSLIDYPSHQRRLIPRLAETYALNFAAHDLADAYASANSGDDESAKRELETLAAGLKSIATWHATHTVQECREACGGQGYRSENRFAALKADSDIFTTFEGDNTVLLQLVGRGLLGAFKAQFADLRWYDALRRLSQVAFDAVSDRNPVTVRWTDEAHLRSLAYHAQVMRAREDSLTFSLARRLKRRIDDGLDPFDAFTEVQSHVLALARAHVEREVQERFARRVEECKDGPTRDALQALASLYGLRALERDRAWFLENGFFEPQKSKAIRDQVDALCAELAPQVLALTDAFDIPEQSLAAPIARR